MADLLPHQQVTVGCGLMLAAASRVRLDAATLHQQLHAAIAAVPEPSRNRYGRDDDTWTAITLLSTGPKGEVQPQSALQHLPIVTELLNQEGLSPWGMHIIRQPAGGCLRWHFDPQALHLTICRLLIAGQVPDGAFTWIGHERFAFPAGTLWTGDFSIPHQVENPTDQDRLMIVMDCTVTPAIQALFPPALFADVEHRTALADVARNHLMSHRAQPVQVPAKN